MTRCPRKQQRRWDTACGKYLYFGLRAARYFLDKYEREQAIDLDIYECPHRTGWHLTSIITESES